MGTRFDDELTRRLAEKLRELMSWQGYVSVDAKLSPGDWCDTAVRVILNELEKEDVQQQVPPA